MASGCSCLMRWYWRIIGVGPLIPESPNCLWMLGKKPLRGTSWRDDTASAGVSQGRQRGFFVACGFLLRAMGNMQWGKSDCFDTGGKMDGSPLILSASRSTDIPAFYAEWFMRRLQAGYSFGRILLTATNGSIFPRKSQGRRLLEQESGPNAIASRELDARGMNYYFTFTLNDYAAEQLEPGVPH